MGVKTIKILLAILVLISHWVVRADTLSACQSSLDSVTRSEMSDICYTRYGSANEQFLKWRGYWNNTTNKELIAVTSWAGALSVMSSQSGWRLPTIKELNSLTSKSLIDAAIQVPESFSNNWMLQSWLTREEPVVTLLPISDAYLLSSSYQGNTVQPMVVNIATGLVQSLPAADFNSSKVYILMVKEESPVWLKIVNQSTVPDFTGECLVNSNTNNSDLHIASCTGDDLLERWYYEENTGFIRSYNGLCAKTEGTVSAERIQLGSCEGDAARWNKITDTNDTSRFYFQYKSLPKACFYAAQHGGRDEIVTRDVAFWNFNADGCDDGNDDHVTWKFTL
jgi:hypothetical protein